MLSTSLGDSEVGRLAYLTLRGPQPHDPLDDFWAWYGMDMDDEDAAACRAIARVLKKEFSAKTVGAMGTLMHDDMKRVLMHEDVRRPGWIFPVESAARVKFRFCPTEPLPTQPVVALSCSGDSRSTSSGASSRVPARAHGGGREATFANVRPLTRAEIDDISLDPDALLACVWTPGFDRSKSSLRYNDSSRVNTEIFDQMAALGPSYVLGNDWLHRHLASEAYRVFPQGPCGHVGFGGSIKNTFNKYRPHAKFTDEQLKAAMKPGMEPALQIKQCVRRPSHPPSSRRVASPPSRPSPLPPPTDTPRCVEQASDRGAGKDQRAPRRPSSEGWQCAPRPAPRQRRSDSCSGAFRAQPNNLVELPSAR
jgi:hypothetical protein